MDNLSYLTIVGVIHEQTPLIVLLQIADAHGIDYDKTTINEPFFVKEIVNAIYEAEKESRPVGNLAVLARFVNKDTKWNRSKLQQAYNFLQSFVNCIDPLSLLPPNYTIGLQTCEQPLNVNAMILYKICKAYQLNINFYTTFEQMATAVKMLRTDPASLIRRVQSWVTDAGHRDLVNILLLSTHEIDDPEDEENTEDKNLDSGNFNVTQLDAMYTSLQNVHSLQRNLTPSTSAGAVSLAAIIYKKDISKSKYAIHEYNLLKTMGDNYVPYDKTMKYWYQQNSAYFDLTKTYNPIFSEMYYSPDTLIHFYNEFRVDPGEGIGALHLGLLTDNFFWGPLPGMSDETPILLSDVSEVEYGELLCYGEYNVKLTPISLDELIDTFTTNRDFTSPFQRNSVLTASVIRKLKHLLLMKTGVKSLPLSEATITKRKELYDVIVSVENLQKTQDIPTRKLIERYKGSAPVEKQQIAKILTQLLHAGMYMRGWKGGAEPYPVNLALVPTSEEVNVDFNVTKSIVELRDMCQEPKFLDIGTQILELPLIKYVDGQYQTSTSKSNGLTIRDRLNIVTQGTASGNVSSCIRLSSNWICATAHRYLTTLGFKEPFNISELRSIS